MVFGIIASPRGGRTLRRTRMQWFVTIPRLPEGATISAPFGITRQKTGPSKPGHPLANPSAETGGSAEGQPTPGATRRGREGDPGSPPEKQITQHRHKPKPLIVLIIIITRVEISRPIAQVRPSQLHAIRSVMTRRMMKLTPAMDMFPFLS